MFPGSDVGSDPGWCCLVRSVRDMPGLWVAHFPPSYSWRLSPGVVGMLPRAYRCSMDSSAHLAVSMLQPWEKRCCPCGVCALESTSLSSTPPPEMSWRGKWVCAISPAFSLHQYISTGPGLANCPAPQVVLASSPSQPLLPLLAPHVPMGRCGGAGGSEKGAGWTGLTRRKVSPVFS